MTLDRFDPKNINEKHMKLLALNIEEYLEVLKEIMIIPEEIFDKEGENIKNAMKTTEKLIRKLKNGDISVFKDEDDMTLLDNYT